MKDNILFCSALKTNTRAVDVMEKLAVFVDQEGLDWKNVCGMCTDGSPAMRSQGCGVGRLRSDSD